jgi:DNA-(apurinic or apyrimidinic site) lyase
MHSALIHRLKKHHLLANGENSLHEFIKGGITEAYVDWCTTGSPTLRANRDWFLISNGIGESPHSDSDARIFREELLDADGMVDSLLWVTPRPLLPFTCWDQSRNRRVENEGCRIDYIFIDASLAPHISSTERREGLGDMFIVNADNLEDTDVFSAFDGKSFKRSVKRNMANGLYPTAPMDGSGLPSLRDEAKMVQFANLPCTGLYVSPPQFSDHIGVCLLLDIAPLQARTGAVHDPKAAMWRRMQNDIRRMFAALQRRRSITEDDAGDCREPPSRKQRLDVVIIED